MNKSLYNFGIYFLGLTAACYLLQGLITFTIGEGIYRLDSFTLWTIGVGIISTIGSLFLLKYFRYCKYRFAFYTTGIALIANICYVIALCGVLMRMPLLNFYKLAAVVYMFVNIIYAAALIFSGSKKNLWLKAAGIYGLVTGLILFLTSIWGASIQRDVLLRITQWALLASRLMPVLLILHFKAEIKLLTTVDPDIPVPEPKEDMLTFGKLSAGIIALILGGLITSQCYSQLYWGKQGFENTKAMVRLFEARRFINGKGDTLRYRLLKPLNYDPKKRYALVISLPYGGQPGNDTIRQIEGAQAAEILSTDSNRKKYPAFIFVPNCPAGSGWGGIPNYPSIDTLVYKAISALDTIFSIDVKRRYVTGVSRGGYGTWHFICTRPDMFAAAIPVCGGENPELAIKIVNVAVWAFHGAKDQNVPVTESRDMIEEMKKGGLNPRYTEYPDEGHNIWYKVSTTPGLWDWLFSQRRN